MNSFAKIIILAAAFATMQLLSFSASAASWHYFRDLSPQLGGMNRTYDLGNFFGGTGPLAGPNLPGAGVSYNKEVVSIFEGLEPLVQDNRRPLRSILERAIGDNKRGLPNFMAELKSRRFASGRINRSLPLFSWKFRDNGLSNIVQRTPPTSTPQVPLPPAAWFMLSGLGVLGLRAKLRKRADAGYAETREPAMG